MSDDDISVNVIWSERTIRKATIKVDPAKIRYDLVLKPDDVITEDMIRHYLHNNEKSWAKQLYFDKYFVNGYICDDIGWELILDEINVIT